MFYGSHHDLVNRYGISVQEMTTDCSVRHNNNPVLSSCMTCYMILSKILTWRMWSMHCLPFPITWVHPIFGGVRVAQSLVVCVFFLYILFAPFLLSIFWLSASGYHFVTFKIFFANLRFHNGCYVYNKRKNIFLLIVSVFMDSSFCLCCPNPFES